MVILKKIFLDRNNYIFTTENKAYRSHYIDQTQITSERNHQRSI